ncbi:MULTISPECIES: DUF1080 domain-containing protein [Sphingobacterium]|uniref:DUF1080 domain-containing protein n=1 Tax=Sphingobacterium litopenaei TaxID=2763500 RepID=A0ABR7YHF0_9SPHI|nr:MULTISPECIES: DUF1080 domain-containing protein [Sphingobacterium]MBD1430701.1 DUF1080 domain-containing protein [Sphingobacterium litopenaei]NGM74006.1 DUF1080 domain-containing protein [Sphingobacterium sp. SGL-16]
MKHHSKLTLFILFNLACTPFLSAQTKFQPQDTEFYEPKSKVVHTTPNKAPSDAIVLFDGTDLKQWVSTKNSNTDAPWTIKDGILTVKPGSGDIQTKQEFEDFQLHIEWKSPDIIKGQGQGRGNSGIFLQGKYELQVLDNDNNPTYVNGQAGSIYKQRQPLVSAVKPAGEWHTYDILYTAPRFNKDNILIKKGTVTVLHNGVVVQYNTQIEGTTEYIGMPQVIPHGAGPLILQDHGDLVSFRNIWIRPL